MTGKEEKIEVRKGGQLFYFTGVLIELENDWVRIDTTRGEVLKFRKEQIECRQDVDTIQNKGGS